MLLGFPIYRMGNFNEWMKKKMDGGMGGGPAPGPAPGPSPGPSPTPPPSPPSDGDHDHDHDHHSHFVGVFGWPWWVAKRDKKKKKECKHGKTKSGTCRKKPK